MEPSFDKRWEEVMFLEELQSEWQALNPRVRQEIIELCLNRAVLLVNELSYCESSIEQLLAAHLVYLAERKGYFENDALIINPQTTIRTPAGEFRVDFYLAASIDGQGIQLVVECDGHDFHEKTKEQARRDKKRDRALKLAGFDVIRFAGSEIWENPRACAQEVFRHLEALANKRRG